MGRNFSGRAGTHDLAAAGSALGSQVDDPIGRLDHVEIVLDHEYRIAGVDKVVQHLEQQLDVGKVQTRGRLVEQVQRLSGALLDQLAGELDPLRFAAREGRGGLAEFQIVEPHVVQRLQLVSHLGDILKMLQGLLHVHLEHVGDVLALEANLQRLAIEAVAFAHRAGHPDVGQEVHLQLVRAVAFAGLAAPARDVEAEPPRLVAPLPRLGQMGEQIANLVEQFDVRGRVRAGRAADR